jgi:hypothetical protein
MTFKKIRGILGVLLIFGLILGTNLIDQNNFEKIQVSIESIYEDRLVVKGLIYDIYKDVHEKEVAIIKRDSLYYKNENNAANQRIDDELLAYDQTRLTRDESVELKKLKVNIAKLKSMETRFINEGWNNQEALIIQINEVDQNLDVLADIQIEEGRREMGTGKQIVSAVNLFTNMEVIGLIILALVFQIMIIYTPKKERD